MITHVNRLSCTITNAPGYSGDLTISAAIAGYRTFDATHDGKLFNVIMLNGTSWEIRTKCKYTHSTKTLSRGVLQDSSTGSAISLTSATLINVTPTAGWANHDVAERLDDQRRLMSQGTLLCDWISGTISGASYTVDTTSNSPYGAGVVTIAGESTVDGTTGASGNAYVDSTTATIDTSRLKTVGIWVRVPARNPARKNYRNVPLKLLLAQSNTFSNYLQLTFNARADGKWHFYTLDITASTNISFTLGTNTIGYLRVRASIDQGVSDNSAQGTASLQLGETAYLGGIVLNPKIKAMAMIRFDDMLESLKTVTTFVLTAPFVGASGVTVPTGSYSAYDLVTAFGHKATSFILTRYIGHGSPFETVANLKLMQAEGWEICFQTHYNGVSTLSEGDRLLGPLGYAWFPAASNIYATSGTITTTTNNFTTSPGQGNPIILTGSPPSPLVTGTVYWAHPISSTTHRLYATEADALAQTSPITFATNSSATWGWRHGYSANDSTAITANMAAGKAAMAAAGLNGFNHWAPNQGAHDVYLEDAFYETGFDTCFAVEIGVDAAGLGISSQFNPVLGLNDMNTHLPTFFTTLSAFQTDTVGKTEAGARAYVQKLCMAGGIGSNVHHSPSNANTLVLCAYLDELKLRQDAGELEVATPSRIARYISNISFNS